MRNSTSADRDVRIHPSEGDHAAPDLPPDLAAALREWRASRRAHDAVRATRAALVEQLAATKALLGAMGRMLDEAGERAADSDADLAGKLMKAGPVVQGVWRYQGVEIGGLMTVVRTPSGEFPPDRDGGGGPVAAAHACCEVRDDDGYTD